MINIRPISDLRNKFKEVEEQVQKDGPVFLTKNGYGSMVVMTVEQYAALTDEVEMKLLEADRHAAENDVRLNTEEVFDDLRAMIHEQQAI